MSNISKESRTQRYISRNPKPKVIDASTLEGGGQLLRTALSISALISTPLHLHTIRGGRPRGGGLKAQHLAAVRWLAQASNARLEGAALRSRALFFEPGRRDEKSKGDERRRKPSGQYRRSMMEREDEEDEDEAWWTPGTLPDGTTVRCVDVEVPESTAAAVTLVLQALLPFLIFSPTSPGTGIGGMAASKEAETPTIPYLLTLHGGTNVSFSPSIDYVAQVLFPNLMLLGFPNMQVCMPAPSLTAPPTSTSDLAPTVSTPPPPPQLPFRRGWEQSQAQPGQVSILISPLQQGTTLRAPLIPPPRNHPKTCTPQLAHISITLLASPAPTLTAIHARTLHALAAAYPHTPLLTARIEDSGAPSRLYLLLVAQTASGVLIGADQLWHRSVKQGAAGQSVVEALVDGAVTRLREELSRGATSDADANADAEADASHYWDAHMQDQLVVYAALAKGRTPGQPHAVPTLHTRTARWVVGELLGVEVDESGGCTGTGLVARRRSAAGADCEIGLDVEMEALDVRDG